jgi:hypothetical protein
MLAGGVKRLSEPGGYPSGFLPLESAKIIPTNSERTSIKEQP